MKTRKIFSILALLLILFSVLSVRVFAEEIQGSETPALEPSPTEVWLQQVSKIIEEHKNGDVNVIYTDDSVCRYGMSWNVSVDVLTKNVYFEIINELPMGYMIYDDPETPHIDGIRLNGDTVLSNKVAIDISKDIDYELIVRVVYEDGFAGTLAQISDGTYDWAQLLENPIGLLMALYYVLATVLVLASVIALFLGKNKKVKTANDISKEVTSAAAAAATKIVEEQVLPIVTAFQNTSQSLVKAFALTTSKSKEAPVALLDVLQDVSSTDAAAAIAQAKELVANAKDAADTAREELLKHLNNIASTSQEVSSNGTEQSEQEKEEDVAIF